MKQTLKKHCLLLMSAFAFSTSAIIGASINTVQVSAATYTTNTNAALRVSAYKTARAILYIPSGEVVEYIDSVYNSYGHEWYKVSYCNNEGYVYSDNISKA